MPLPQILIIGGGFGGLSAAKALKRCPARVTLIDRTNHHLFQPLLYQVATADLTPGEIAAPIRQVLASQSNTTVLMQEVVGVDPAARQVLVHRPDGLEQSLDYDYLILATGAHQSYFGHDEWRPFAPGLKTLTDATLVRERILRAFELAEMESPSQRSPGLLNFIFVGGGPTGVEMAGAIAELARTTRREFRHLDPSLTRVILIEGGPRILPSFDESLAAKVHQRLTQMGVEILVGRHVRNIDERGVTVGDERIDSRNILWTAGVQPSPAARWLGAPADHIGRVKVAPDLSVPGRPEVFVIGDSAFLEQDGKPLPGVAQVAMQGGQYAAQVIAARIENQPAPLPFRYRNLGNMAVVGRGFAILESDTARRAGWFTWLLWAIIHIYALALFNNRLLVLTQWAWTYFTRQRGSRLILRPADDSANEKL